MCIGLRLKYPLFLSDFNETSIFSTGFFKNTQISDFIKIVPLAAGLCYADYETDRQKNMTKLKPLLELRDNRVANRQDFRFSWLCY